MFLYFVSLQRFSQFVIHFVLKEKKRRNKERRRRRRLEKEFGRDLVNKETLVFPFFGLIFPLIFSSNLLLLPIRNLLSLLQSNKVCFQFYVFSIFLCCTLFCFLGGIKKVSFLFFRVCFSIGFSFSSILL